MDYIGPDGKVYKNVPEGVNPAAYGLKPATFNPPESDRAGAMDAFLSNMGTSAISGPVTSRVLGYAPDIVDQGIAKIESGARYGAEKHPDAAEAGRLAGSFASPESWASGKIGGLVLGQLKKLIQSNQILKTAPSLKIGKVNPNNPAEMTLAEDLLTKPGEALASDVAGAAVKPAIGAATGGAAGYGLAGPVGGEFGSALGAAIGGEPIKHTLGGFLTMPLSAAQRAAFSPAVRYQGAKMLPGIGNIGGRLTIPDFLKGLVEEEYGPTGR